ncbi:MAG: hypothetical protein ABI700_00745 [Chloroflexota bacterium]
MDTIEPRKQGLQLGVDIGQQHDPTAVVVAERQLRDYHWPDPDRRHPDDRVVGGDIHYVIRYIKRMPLKTPYPAVADRLAEIYFQLTPAEMPQTVEDRIMERSGQTYHRSPPWHDASIRDVLVDGTGVGRPVIDLIRDKGVECTAVYFTGGDKATAAWRELRLAKVLMVSRLQVLLQQRFIHLPPDDEEAQEAAKELLNFEIKVTDSANLQMGAFKVGTHDDLVTALGLACWEDASRNGEFWIGSAPDALNDYFLG